ncbi:MAG: MerR family DNA-binding transcriptional regulator [Betaproteobacteria bacterium]|nr:MerR family DNA-binding transcriptional regulator [Betaproteobacteria bacterium]
MEVSGMLPIKEFSEFTGLNESTLRYYDKIGLLVPALRGENRYRYYSPLQAITVNFIKVLTKLGVPLSTIKDMSNDRTPRGVLTLLAQQENKLNRRLVDLQTTYSIIHTFRNNIEAGIFAHERDMSVQELDEEHLTLGPATDFSDVATFYKPFMEFCNTAHENNINLYYPIGGYYENVDIFVNAPSQPTRFFSQDPSGNNKRRAGQYLVAYNRGYYGEFGDFPQRLLSYARTNNLIFSGPLFVSYLLDELSTVEYTQYLSQVVVGVSKK